MGTAPSLQTAWAVVRTAVMIARTIITTAETTAAIVVARHP
jgi:hypothetical protein